MPTVQFFELESCWGCFVNFFATLTKVNSGIVELKMDFTHPKHDGSWNGMVVLWYFVSLISYVANLFRTSFSLILVL